MNYSKYLKPVTRYERKAYSVKDLYYSMKRNIVSTRDKYLLILRTLEGSVNKEEKKALLKFKDRFEKDPSNVDFLHFLETFKKHPAFIERKRKEKKLKDSHIKVFMDRYHRLKSQYDFYYSSPIRANVEYERGELVKILEEHAKQTGYPFNGALINFSHTFPYKKRLEPKEFRPKCPAYYKPIKRRGFVEFLKVAF